MDQFHHDNYRDQGSLMSCLCCCKQACMAIFRAILGVILFIASVSFVVLAIVILTNANNIRYTYEYLDMPAVRAGIPVLMGMGVYLVCLSLLGLYAMCSSSSAPSKLFAWLSLVNVVVAIVSVGYFPLHHDGLKAELMSSLHKSMQDYNWNGVDAAQSEPSRMATKLWDRVQSSQRCCGLDSKSDWDPFRPLLWLGKLYPVSCCSGDQIDRKSCNDSMASTRGCLMTGVVLFNITAVVIAVTFGVSIIVAVISALRFLCSPARQDRAYNYNV